MSVYAATIEALEADPTIEAAWREASAGDRSVLSAALEYEGSEMATTEGSPNHRLWSRLAEHGWLELIDGEGPPNLPFKCITAKLTEPGWRAIPVVLGRLGTTNEPAE
jgi:hypothetical protein